MRKFAKIILRNIYRLLPLKKQIFTALRSFGLGGYISQKLKVHLAFDAPFSISVGGSNFFILNGYGREVESMIFWDGLSVFEGETLPYWERLSARSKVILDVGANTGVYSLIAKAVNPSAEVYAFEPIKRVFEILDKNARINRNDHSIISVHQVALSDYSGKGEMYDLPVEHMYTASLNKNVHAERGNPMLSCIEEVQVKRLDEFLEQHGCGRVDLIKIDVESHEPSVLKGLGDRLVRWHPSLIVEIWNNQVGEAVEAVLQGCNYIYFALTSQGPLQCKNIRNNAHEKGFINYLICTESVAGELGLAGYSTHDHG